MPHTIIGWSKSVDEGGTDTALTPIVDPMVREEGDFIYVPTLNNIIGAMALLGSTGTKAYVDAPSLRALNPYFIQPIGLELAPSGEPIVEMHPQSPTPLNVNEGMKAYANADPSAAEQHTVLIMMSDGAIAPETGNIFHARATAAATEAAGKWVLSELTFEDVLPEGRYAIVGARCVCSGNGIAFRFVPVGEVNRPGGWCVNSVNALDPPYQRNGGLGVWLEFDALTPPSVEILASASGGTSQELILDLIRR